MSLIATAKAKAARGSVKEAFSNEQGAIDLASIMVGIIVIGLIGGVIAATVFAVIPWAQDNAAKQQLDSVAAAQSAYIGLSSDPTHAAGGTDGRIGFGTAANLDTAGLFDAAAANVLISVTGENEDSHYVAAATSASGNSFYIADTKTNPTTVENSTTAEALTAGKTFVSATATWTE